MAAGSGRRRTRHMIGSRHSSYSQLLGVPLWFMTTLAHAAELGKPTVLSTLGQPP